MDHMHAAVTSMALSNDGNCVLASCLDARLRLLDKGSGELLAEYKGVQSLCCHVMVCYIACAQSCSHVVKCHSNSEAGGLTLATEDPLLLEADH